MPSPFGFVLVFRLLSFVFVSISLILSSPYEIHDLDPVTLAHDRRLERRTFDHDEIEFDGDATRIDVQPIQQLGNCYRRVELVRVPIESDQHCCEVGS